MRPWRRAWIIAWAASNAAWDTNCGTNARVRGVARSEESEAKATRLRCRSGEASMAGLFREAKAETSGGSRSEFSEFVNRRPGAGAELAGAGLAGAVEWILPARVRYCLAALAPREALGTPSVLLRHALGNLKLIIPKHSARGTWSAYSLPSKKSGLQSTNVLYNSSGLHSQTPWRPFFLRPSIRPRRLRNRSVAANSRRTVAKVALLTLAAGLLEA